MACKSAGNVWCSILIGIVGAFQTTTRAASIATTYKVTDLGNTYSLNQGPDGNFQSLTAGDGLHVYAFDKTPVTQIFQQSVAPLESTITTYTMQVGSHKAGYSIYPPAGVSNPTGYNSGSDWFARPSVNPVADMNSQGQVVGMGNLSRDGFGPSNNFAAFSRADGTPHPTIGSPLLRDDLNEYLVNAPGVNLTSAVKVDDLGRIVAEGTLNGKAQDFLLTPTGLLADPIATPEPSPLCVLIIMISYYIVRKLQRTSSLTDELLKT